MNTKEIIKLLKARFPLCEVASDEFGVISVYFPSIDTEIMVQENGKNKFYVGVIDSVRSETIEGEGYDIGTFEYVSPAKVVEKVVEGTERIFKGWDEFEKQNDAIQEEIGEPRSKIPGFEDVRPALRKEIGNG